MMNNEIGFDESLEKQNAEVETFFLPVILIPIGKYLIATVIIYHVIMGIIKAG